MIKLCGSAISNYYNNVKLALLEKGIPFEEEPVMSGAKDEAVLSCSPLGKVPFLRTPQGPLCESEAIMGYLEAIAPNPPLLPADPLRRQRCASCRSSSTCTSNWWRASCIRRPFSAAR
jgi:glutathione S-transferase